MSSTPTTDHGPAIRYGAPIATGVLILAATIGPWMWASRLNARIRPDLPWAAVASLLWFGLVVMWLHGWGPPGRSAEGRRQRLRLWPPGVKDAGGLPVGVVIALLALLTVAWTAMSRMSPVPDLAAYPTTAYRWSMFLMGGFASGLMEEVAFRGYMQTGIERFDRKNAIWITSLVFVAAHITHGIGAVLVLGPGMFVASLLYGTLARRTGTILPGILLHTAGDLARMYFGVLRGDASLLFATC